VRWPWFRMAIHDSSMVPTYLPGDRLLVRRHGRLPRAGDVVVCTDDVDGGAAPITIHRVVSVVDRDHLMVVGDNPSLGSTSRHERQVTRSQVLGRVVARVSSAERPPRRDYR